MALFVHFIDVDKTRNTVILEYVRTRASAVRTVPRYEGKVSVHNACVAVLKYRTSFREIQYRRPLQSCVAINDVLSPSR